MQSKVFITGATGYIGRALIPQLLARGHRITALVREGSEKKIKSDCALCVGNALDGDSYRAHLNGVHTFIHLVGVPHPSPAKAPEFVAVDKKSAQEAIRVASAAGIQHFIYVSVAQPAPVMKAYWEVRAACEASLRASGLNATIVRPWYVLGPGHRWPLFLAPFCRAAELVPSMRDGAIRLGLVTLDQMVRTLASATDQPATGIRILNVPEIRRFGDQTRTLQESSSHLN